MSDIETNLIDGLIGFAGLGNSRSANSARDLGFGLFYRGITGLDGDGVVPLRGEIDFSGTCSRLG